MNSASSLALVSGDPAGNAAEIALEALTDVEDLSPVVLIEVIYPTGDMARTPAS